MPLSIKPRILDDLATFSQAQLDSEDVDPVYPVLTALYTTSEDRALADAYYNTTSEDRALTDDLELSLLHTFLYVAYYNIASAQMAWPYADPLKPSYGLPDSVLRYPTGIERRGLRGGANMAEHLESLRSIVREHGSFEAWLTQGFQPGSPKANWRKLQETLQEPKFNGRWAAYKTGEILYRVHSFNVEPTDMGMAFSSGPRWGLALFYGAVEGNGPKAVRELDKQAVDLLHRLENGYGVHMGIEQLETMLCDFHSLHMSRYYVGHDIDQMQEQLLVANDEYRLRAIWQARAEALPHAYLGELHNWTGVDKIRQLVYSRSGKIVVRG